MITYIISRSAVFAGLAFFFSVISMLHPDSRIMGNPFEVSMVTPEHIVGHVLWGLIIGVFTLSLRYFLLSGFFPILLDSDHLIQFLNVAIISRMAHSIMFGIFAAIVMIVIFKKLDFKLAAVAFSSVFIHISFDNFLGSEEEFPLFIPLNFEFIKFQASDWIVFILIAAGVLIIFTWLHKKKKLISKIK